MQTRAPRCQGRRRRHGQRVMSRAIAARPSLRPSLARNHETKTKTMSPKSTFGYFLVYECCNGPPVYDTHSGPAATSRSREPEFIRGGCPPGGGCGGGGRSRRRGRADLDAGLGECDGGGGKWRGVAGRRRRRLATRCYLRACGMLIFGISLLASHYGVFRGGRRSREVNRGANLRCAWRERRSRAPSWLAPAGGALAASGGVCRQYRELYGRAKLADGSLGPDVRRGGAVVARRVVERSLGESSPRPRAKRGRRLNCDENLRERELTPFR